MKNKNLKKITVTAMLTAMSAVFELLTEYVPGLNIKMPMGGSPFGLSMLPIIITGILVGIPYGVASGAILGIINWLIGGAWVHWGTIIFDYLLAFSVLGLSGLNKKALKSTLTFILTIFCVCFLRYVLHSLSGMIFFSEYAGDTNVFLYSFILYNGPYMAVSTAICIVVGVLLRPSIIKMQDKLDLATSQSTPIEEN